MAVQATRYDRDGYHQVGQFDPADLDDDGTFNTKKFFDRLRLRDHEWLEVHDWRPDWKLKPVRTTP